jgi:hypothetical protein
MTGAWKPCKSLPTRNSVDFARFSHSASMDKQEQVRPMADNSRFSNTVG